MYRLFDLLSTTFKIVVILWWQYELQSNEEIPCGVSRVLSFEWKLQSAILSVSGLLLPQIHVVSYRRLTY